MYRSTATGSVLKDWNANTKKIFENQELPELRKKSDWGYVFADNKEIDSWLFMFHGYRPRTEAGKASFYRFDFDWQVDPHFLYTFASELISLVPCLSGFAGYYLQGRVAYSMESYDTMFAISHRYWGLEAHNLDVTVNQMLSGYKCVNWLTIIGDKFRQANPEAIEQAKQVAMKYHETEYAILFQADEVPRFGDQNRREVLSGYVAIAKALLPLQIREHEALGGTRWTDDNTIEWIQRFAPP